jgi:tetraacyldisaccharide 4'-kinase
MLARALPDVVVAVGRRRADAGRLVLERVGRRVFVLDDGFQHLALERDFDVVCVQPEDLQDRPLPAGRLRETVDALARADAILVEGDPTELRRRFGADRVFRFARHADGGVPARPFLLTGIARPERFAASVPAAVGAQHDDDHHPWTEWELARVARTAQDVGADAVLTTAKDAVRLPAGIGGLPVRVLAQRLEIEDEPRLRERLLKVARG